MARRLKYIALVSLNILIVYYVVTMPISILSYSTKLLTENSTAQKNPVLPQDLTLLPSQDTGVLSKKEPPISTKIIPEHTHKDIDILLTRPVYLTNDEAMYFIHVGNKECFVHGTDFTNTSAKSELCVCLEGYFGKDCGIPASAWFSFFSFDNNDAKLIRREVPRRVIQGLVVNHEFDLTEIRFHDLGSVIDAYIIGESNYSTFGDAKPLRFKDKFEKGFLQEFHHKILYVFQEFYPQEAFKDGWVADSYIRTHMSVHGLPKVLNTRPDDLFLLFDADELPSRESVLFLKLYDGYPEPIAFALRWSIYGLFWAVPSNEEVRIGDKILKGERPTTITAGATLKFLDMCYQNDSISIRRNSDRSISQSVKHQFETLTKHKIQTWTIGTAQFFAGHHCSWCMTPEDIVIKLTTANREDKPRWGDYPQKLDLEYIKSLIKTGTWFNDVETYQARSSSVDNYGPPYLLKNVPKYKGFVKNPYT